MTFCKYQFSNTQDWATYQSQISVDGAYQNCAVHEIGQICFATDDEGNCTDLSKTYAVDILWYEEPLESFAIKEVFPEIVGVHVFSGCEQMYFERFCQMNPLNKK
jgi:hypothetical protein